MAGGWGLKESKLINRWGEGAQLTKATKKDKRIPGSLTALCVCACSMASMFKYKHFLSVASATLVSVTQTECEHFSNVCNTVYLSWVCQHRCHSDSLKFLKMYVHIRVCTCIMQ